MPNALDEPSPNVGNAMATTPTNPTAKPYSCARDGRRLYTKVATDATNNGMAPFNMPATLEATRSSAKGNMVSGTAIQMVASNTNRGQASRGNRTRAAGTKASVAKPNPMRMGVITAAGKAFRPSAMK